MTAAEDDGARPGEAGTPDGGLGGGSESHSNQVSAMVDWALHYAAHGLLVLPTWGVTSGVCDCGKGTDCGRSTGKHPIGVLVPDGFKSATADEPTIRSWWAKYPNANVAIACGASDLVVVDCDFVINEDDSVVDGEEEFQWLADDCGFDPAELASTRTGGGGRHYFFRAEPGVEIRSIPKGDLGRQLEVKAIGGYIVVGPSEHALGRYEPTPVDRIGPIPRGLLARLTGPRGGASRGASGDSTAYREMKKTRLVVRGSRDDFFNRRAFELRRLGLSREAAEVQLRGDWEACEQPPGDAYPWEKAVEKIDRTWAKTEPDEPSPAWDPRRSSRKRAEGRLEVLDVRELLNRPKPEWLVETNVLPSKGAFQIFGETGVGKTFVVLDLLLSIATGGSFLDHFAVREAAGALYVAGEGDWDLGQRVAGWMQAHGGEVPERFLAMVDQGVDLRSDNDVDEIITICQDKAIGIAVLDTWALHVVGDENTARDAGPAISNLKRLAAEADCLAGTVHHVGHENKQRARGWSGMKAAWDVEFEFDGRLLRQTKNRYAEKIQPVGVELSAVGGTLVPRRIEAYSAIASADLDLADRVLMAVQLEPGLGLDDIQRKVAANRSRVRETLRQLIEDGRVETEKDGQKNTYRPAESGR